jgi:rhodanese-related sulfurtransferase
MRYLLALIIFTIGLSTACQQAASQDGNNANNKAKATPTAKTPDEAKRISIQDAKAAFDAGKAIIVDVRSEDSFNSEHIKDAISMPIGELEIRWKELPMGKDVIFYCSCPAEHTSVMAVNTSKEKGMNNTAAMVGGTDAWKNAGYPMAKEKGAPKQPVNYNAVN